MHRIICEVYFSVSLILVAIFLLNTYKISVGLSEIIQPDVIAVSLSGISLITAAVAHFLKSKKANAILRLIGFLGLMSALGYLIATSSHGSPGFYLLATLWLIVSMTSGIFGAAGILIVFLSGSVYLGFSYTSGQFDSSIALSIVIFTLLPTAIGSFVRKRLTDQPILSQNSKNIKNLASELNEVASKSEVVINAIGDGVIAIDGRANIQLINPAAQMMIGWGKQDAINLNYKSILKIVNEKDEVVGGQDDPIEQVLNTNQQVRTNKLTLISKNDKKIMVSMVVSPVGDPGSGIIAVFRDITKEKAEEREQAEFISTASHEMRTPVASIEGYLGLAMNPQTASIDERARDFIMKAHGAAEHLGHLFQDLLDVSKADDGRMSNNPSVKEMVAFVAEIVEGLQQKANDKGLQLIFKPKNGGSNERIIAPVYYTNVDNDHVREIVNNLVENGIKYTQKGSVVVDISGDENHVVISVKDSGIGIPSEDMPHLFQKFYRVDNKDTREIGGTGLGLYLCRRLVEIIGGRIWAESVFKKGSTFFVELPRLSNQEARQLLDQVESQQPIAPQINQQQPTTPTGAPQQSPGGLIMDVIQRPKNNEPANNVPRSQALTPEQIAAYVAKQRELIKQQQVSQPQIRTASGISQPAARVQGVAVPNRNII